MKKVLITGSNGLLGQKLVSLYLRGEYREKYAVVATSRGENRINRIEGFYYRSMDVCQAEEIRQVLDEEKVDVVIHTAAMTQVDLCETEREACWELNVKSVEYLSKACEERNILFIHLSTDFIFDGEAGPYAEEDGANPISYYGESKWAAEQVIKASTGPWAIVRTVLVYGISEAMSRSNIILWVKKSLESGKTIHVVDDQWRSPTLAEDLAKGCFLIAEQGARGVFNISGSEVLTPYEMAIETADFFQLDKSLIERTDGSQFKQAAKRPPRTGLIIDKARKELGYQPRTFTEGIAILKEQIKSFGLHV